MKKLQKENLKLTEFNSLGLRKEAMLIKVQGKAAHADVETEVSHPEV